MLFENKVHVFVQKGKKRNKNEVWGWIFAMPAILGLVVFTIGPMIASLYFSFTDVTLGIKGNFIGLENYKKLFTKDPFFLTSLKVTFSYALMSVPINLIYAFMVAILLNVDGVRGVKVYRTLVYLPSIVPAVASGMLWKWLFNPNFGLLNQILNFFGLPGSEWIFDK
ncbi:MAG TPA: sugar ABC transporter permease, partial [Tissierellaceae bacterium]